MKYYPLICKAAFLFVVTMPIIIVTQSESYLVDLEKYIPEIVFDMRYATPNNFTGRIIYSQPKAYLLREAAQALKRVQARLHKLGYTLVVWDAYRPHSAQELFWKICPNPKYVQDPKLGSRHSRGCAIDCTIKKLDGTPLVMPSEFDDFSPLAHRDYALVSEEAKKNALLMEKIFEEEGFSAMPTEWWHFDYVGADRAQPMWKNLPILHKTFEELEKEVTIS